MAVNVIVGVDPVVLAVMFDACARTLAVVDEPRKIMVRPMSWPLSVSDDGLLSVPTTTVAVVPPDAVPQQIELVELFSACAAVASPLMSSTSTLKQIIAVERRRLPGNVHHIDAELEPTKC